MRNAKATGRLGLLAVGLGIGAALAATPGAASADSSTEPFSLIDQLLGGLSAPAQTTLDMQISIDGFDLFPTADNTAKATSDIGDLAIAIGSSDAFAQGGVGNFAFADGAPSLADAGLTGTHDSFDTAIAVGNVTDAVANLGNDDTAIIFGNGPADAFAEFGNGDLATVFGNDSSAIAQFGSNDIASVVGTDSSATAGGDATTPADFDLAAAFGDMLHAMATGGSNLIDIVTPFGTL